MSADYMSGVAFTTRKIDEINVYIQQHISPRAYLAAYYAPKVHQPGNDEGLFWCAVTNLYGLFKDCVPNVFALLKMLYKRGFLSYDDREKADGSINIVNALRSAYCHNVNAGIFSKNLKILQDVRAFFIDDQDESSFQIPQLQPDKWGVYIENICDGAETSVDSIYAALRCAAEADEVTKYSLADDFGELLAQWLGTSKFFSDVVTDELKHMGKSRYSKDIENEVESLNEKARTRFIASKPQKEQFKDSKYKHIYWEIIREMSEPALPYITTKALLQLTKTIKAVK